MPEVKESVRIAMDADDIWRRAGDFGAVGDWHPLAEHVESGGNEPGDTRRVLAADGSRQVERLDSYDSAEHIYRYSMQETELPVEHYTGEFEIDDRGDGTSAVTWTAHFDVTSGDQTATLETVRQFFRTGLEALAKRYG